MANDLRKSLFFAGGKIIFPETNENTEGLKFTKQDDGSWKVTIDLIIAKTEAEGVMNKYSEFHELEEDRSFEEVFPNQVYLEAFDENDNSIGIKFRKIELNILNAQKTEAGGEIILRMTPVSGIGKTQNSDIKTQNPETVIHPPVDSN